METYQFVEKIGYAELHVFPYSRRTGTPAARMENQVDPDVKDHRVQQMISLSDRLAKEYAKQFENTVLEVIPEEISENDPNYVEGYSDNYIKVRFAGSRDLIGSIVKVKITKADYPYSEGLFVKVCKALKTS